VVPETVEQAAEAPKASATTTVEAPSNDRSLPPAEDYVVSDAISEDWILLAFYNAEEAILSVHSTSDVVSCGTPVSIKPLADRLVVEPRAASRLTSDGTVFTRVYAPVTRAALDDFLADVCLFLDTATPAAQRRTFWAYSYTSYNQSSEATTPYTLTITGPLLDASEDPVHLHLVRHYLVPPGGDPSDVRRLVALGPTMRWTGRE
jgi:hypothetical protein